MRTLFGHQVYNWHLEISSKCTLRCPRCTRTEYPGTYPVTQLSLDFIRRLFKPAFLRNSVQRITLSGGVGDPLYNTQLPEIAAYLKGENPKLQLVIITNGSHKSESFWQDFLGSLNEYDEVIFSIDGWDQASNNLYRVNSDWDSIMRGMSLAVKSKAQVRWSTIIFRFNENKIEDIKELACKSGVDHFHAVLSERFGGHYRDPVTGLDHLEPSEEFRSQIPRTQRFKEKFDTHPEKRQAAREFYQEIDQSFKKSYDETVQKYSGQHILPTCKFGYRGAYVDVEGIFYPCSWVSHPFDVKASHINPERILHYKDGFAKYKDRLNLHLRSLDDILQDSLWKELEEGWKTPENAFIICERKCLAQNSQQQQIQTKPLEELKK
ncbi:radical SAM protein [Bdellovibrio sp. HCB2-146]|uniref:radical SAM protein n=1 Tax=Bdellovibrio sp. HCB2-146 TaxID=3394362 RepID=UPI0039BD086A